MTPETVAHQAPLSMEFSKQEYWSRLLLPSPGDLPDPGMEPASPASPVLAGGFFTTEPPGKPSLTFSSKFILLSHAHHEGHSMHTLLNITEQWLGISETFMASLKGTKISDHCFLFSQLTISFPCYATPLTHIVTESAPHPYLIQISIIRKLSGNWECQQLHTENFFFLNKGEKEQEVLQRQDLKPMMETESMNTQVPHLSTGITWRCIVYGSNWLDNTFHCLPCLFCLISPHLCQYFLSVPLKLLVLKISSLDQLLGNPKPISNPWLP